MNVFLETKRLIITVPELADFQNLYALQNDTEVMKYVGQGVRGEIEVMSGLEKAITHYEKHGFSLGCVFEKETNNFVGRAGLIYLAYDDNQPDIEIGYALTKESWNNGYATELAKEIIHWGFKHLTVDKLVGVINPHNERSRHVLEKAQMSFVGRSTYNGNEVALYQRYRNTDNPFVYKWD